LSSQNPLEELAKVVELCELGLMPREGGEWAVSAFGTAESILKTIDSMRSDGKRAPTLGQARALDNIFVAASNWLDPGNAVHKPQSYEARAAAPRPGSIREGSAVLLSDGTMHIVGTTCSSASPVGQALLGHIAGETVCAVLPGGRVHKLVIETVTTIVQAL
jgi:hypothetical protein